jgi:hypothetical protein
MQLRGGWRWDDPRMPDELFQVIAEETIPRLESLGTLEGFLEFANSADFRYNPIGAFLLRKVKIDAALGDLGGARSICRELATTRTMWHADQFAEELALVMDELCPLLRADDRQGIARLLRTWEEYSVRHFEIEAIWEPTPFPLELPAGPPGT